MGWGAIGVPVPDAIPDAVLFPTETDTQQLTLIESSEVTLTGFNQPVVATVSGGSLKVNGGSYSSLSQIVNVGDVIQLSHTSSDSPDTATSTTLSLGPVVAVFQSRTRVQTANGWPNYRGAPDPSTVIGFDIYADYPFDEVVSGQANIDFSVGGTPGNPRVYDARGVTCERFGASGSNIIVVGLASVTTGEGPVRSVGENVVFRDCTVRGNNSDFGAGSAVTLGNRNAWLRGKVSNFGILDPQYQEQDQHGFKIQADDIWIIDVECTELSGDGVQIGDATRGIGRRVYVCGGRLWQNRENGVDIKDSEDCVVTGVEMYGYGQTVSSPGEAVIIHDDSFRAKVFDCNIHDTRLGIVSSGLTGHEIDGNTVMTGGSYTVYPQNGSPSVQQITGLAAIQLRNTRPITVLNNILTGNPRIEIQSGMSHPDTVIQGQNGAPDTI